MSKAGNTMRGRKHPPDCAHCLVVRSPGQGRPRSSENYVYDAEGRRKLTQAADIKRRHGLTQDQFDALWQAQGGCCYLCEKPLAGTWAIDHDHRCCEENRSCDNCRRGIAHRTCNTAIGQLWDDPDLIEKVAANLRSATKGFLL